MNQRARIRLGGADKVILEDIAQAARDRGQHSLPEADPRPLPCNTEHGDGRRRQPHHHHSRRPQAVALRRGALGSRPQPVCRRCIRGHLQSASQMWEWPVLDSDDDRISMDGLSLRWTARIASCGWISGTSTFSRRSCRTPGNHIFLSYPTGRYGSRSAASRHR